MQDDTANSDTTERQISNLAVVTRPQRSQVSSRA